MDNLNNGTDFVLPTGSPANAGNSTSGQQAGQGELPPGVVDKIRAQAASLRNATAFAQAIGVFMRSAHYREYTIGDLEWLLVPAIMNRQYRIAEAKIGEGEGARTLPTGIVLWAMVSAEVDQRLTEEKAGNPKLQPAEWTSGDIPWLVHAAGEARFVRPIVKQLMQTTFKDRKVKVFGRDANNEVKIHVLEAAEGTAGTA
jgi:cytolysin-activating lysine-acyltransferase